MPVSETWSTAPGPQRCQSEGRSRRARVLETVIHQVQQQLPEAENPCTVIADLLVPGPG